MSLLAAAREFGGGVKRDMSGRLTDTAGGGATANVHIARGGESVIDARMGSMQGRNKKAEPKLRGVL